MLSFTGRRNLWGTLTNNTTSTNLTTGDTLMNASEKRILTSRHWPFLEKKDTTLTTTASTQFYTLPAKVSKLHSVTVTVGTTIYTLNEVVSEDEWNELNSSTTTSDSAEYYYVRAGQVGIWPVPATSSKQITLYYRQIPKDLTIADYTTGSVVSVAAAGTAVVGTGTTWTAAMAGRFLKITDSDTANKGDGFWYEIASSGSGTTITLLRPYAGTAISAGTAAYTIGQMSLLPEGYQELPVYEACKLYYTSIEPDANKAQMYGQMAKELMSQLVRDFSSKTANPVIWDGGDTVMDNPNNYITL